MPEKTTTKTVAITIRRERRNAPKVIVTTGFKLRFDKSTGLIDVLLASSGQKGERVIFDPVLLRTNLDVLKRFVASAGPAQDDAALKEDVSVGDQASFANILHLSSMGGRAESIFGVFSLADWVEATRSGHDKGAEIVSFDNVVAMSTSALQKKLILELILMVGQPGNE
jgi:hypothetical protein